MRVKEKVPLRVKGLVIKVSITVEVLFEGEVGYASKWVGSEGVVKGSRRDRRGSGTRGIRCIAVIGRVGSDHP